MNTDCLTKVRRLVEPEEYAEFVEAQKNGDVATWNKLLENLGEKTSRSQIQAILDLNIKVKLLDWINLQKDQGRAITDLVSGSGTRQDAGITSLDVDAHQMGQYYMSDLNKLVHDGRAKILGLDRSRNTTFARNLLKTIMGETDASTSKAMQGMADGWIRTLEKMRLHFNKLGGNIPKYDKYFLPNNHDADKMLTLGKEQWVKDADKVFDIIWRKKGGAYKSKQDILEQAFDSLTKTQDEAMTLETTKMRRPVKLANRHQVARVLQIKDADSWFKYNEIYGRHTNPIDSMIEHVNGFSTELAAMEKFGTNPTTMFNWLLNEVRRRTGKRLTTAEMSFKHIISTQPPQATGMTKTFRGMRDFQTITKLPMTPLTAMSDVIYESTRAMFNGISPIRTFMRHLKQLNPTSHVDRLRAAEVGMINDYAMSRATAMMRYNDLNGYGMLHNTADFSTRLSGLNPWTNAGKEANFLEYNVTTVKNVKKSWNKVPVNFKRMLTRYGIDEQDWLILRKSVTNKDGLALLDVTQDFVPQETRTKFLGMLRSEVQMAIPEPNAKARAAASWWTEPGSAANEINKTWMQFKPFSMAVTFSHMGTLLDKSTPIMNRVGYATSLITGGATIGVLTIQAREVAKGRSPLPFTPGLVGKGILQAGVFGIVMDILAVDPTKYGGLAGWLAGPTVSDANKYYKMAFGTYQEAMEGGKWFADELLPEVTKEATKLAFPLQTWYSRLAMERLILDDINKKANPNYYGDHQAKRRWLRERGQHELGR